MMCKMYLLVEGLAGARKRIAHGWKHQRSRRRR